MALPDHSSRLRLLNVEDSPSDARLIRALLKETATGVEYCHAERLDQAFEQLRKGRFDVVLLDLGLPDSQGMDTIRRTRRAFPSLPLVVLTGMKDDALASAAMQEGAQDYLVKGHISAEVILRTLRHAVERQSYRDALIASEARNDAILRSALDGIVTVDAEGMILEFNPAAESMFLYPASEAKGQDFRSLLFPSKSQSWRFQFSASANDVSTLGKRTELTATRADKTQLPVEVTMVGIGSTDPPLFTCFIRELTERLEAEDALRESARTRTAILNALPAHIALIDPSGVILDVNDAWRQFALANDLRTPDSGVGSNYLSTCENALELPEAAEARAAILSVLTGQTSIAELEYPCHSPTEHRWYKLLVTPLQDRTEGAVVMHIDVTDRKVVEDTLRTREASYRGIVELAEEGIWVVDEESKTTLVNRRMCQMLGYEGSEMLGRSYWEFVSAEFVEEVRERFSLLTTGPLKQFDMRFRRKDGSDIWTLVSAGPIRDHDNRFAGAQAMITDITQRRRIEEANRFQAGLLDEVGQAAIATDAAGRIIYANRYASSLYGWSREEMIGRDVRDVTVPVQSASQADEIMAQLRSGKSWTGEFLVHRRDGAAFPALVNNTPILGTDGSVTAIIGISSDISEQKKLEAQNNARARQQAAIAELGIRALSGTEVNFLIAEAARLLIATFEVQFCTVVQYSAETDSFRMTAGASSDGTLPEPAALEGGMRSQAGYTIHVGGPVVVEDLRLETRFRSRLLTDHGIISGVSIAIPGEKGPWGSLGMHTTKKREFTSYEVNSFQNVAHVLAQAILRSNHEKALKDSEDRFRVAVRGSEAGLWDWDFQTDSVYFAPRFRELLGYNEEEQFPNVPSSFVSSLDADGVRLLRDSLRSHFRDRTPFDVEFRLRHKTGVFRWFNARGEALWNLEGRAYRMAGSITDINERREAQQRIAEQADLLDKARDAIIVTDLEHQITFWSKGAERVYGWTATETRGLPAFEIQHYDPAEFAASSAKLMEQGEWSGPLKQRARDGRELTVESRMTLVRDEQGQPVSILAINTDITERRKLEQQFLRAQRMESIGTLAGGIAHDLNNVLQPILMFTDVLRVGEKDEKRLKALTTIQASTRRGAEMVRRVLSFARGVDGQKLEVQVDQLIGEIDKLVRETFPKSIHMKTGAPPDLWRVSGDPTQLHQVLLNLAVNARDAMPDGGTLTLRAENAYLKEQGVDGTPSQESPCVKIELADTGSGMEPHIIDQIFDPFFTTKEVGRGTGLGLSTSLSIVKSHGGTLQVYSEPGKGSKFCIYLPASPGSASRATALDETSLIRGNGELVLVIDDELSVREVTRDTLETFGYRVILASDGAEGVAIYSARKAEIDVVLTDMAMPILDGVGTIQVLLRMNPTVRIIAASGLDMNDKLARLAGAGVKHFLPKPYSASTLLTALADVLTGQKTVS